MAGEKFVKLMQEAAKAGNINNDLVYGEVLSLSPLKIKVDNRFTIPEQFILLSALVKEAIVGIEPNQITLWRGLMIGDKVRMLRLNAGQLFYVLEREEGIV